jgi:hypothetical protein
MVVSGPRNTEDWRIKVEEAVRQVEGKQQQNNLGYQHRRRRREETRDTGT